MITQALRRLGRRGGVLLILGAIWIALGVDILVDPVIVPGEGLFHLLIPLPFRVGLWVGCGVLAITGAVYQSPRWQGVGFVALIIPPVQRAASYAGSVILEVTVDRGTYAVIPLLLMFSCLSLLILIIAGWPEDAGRIRALDGPPTRDVPREDP